MKKINICLMMFTMLFGNLLVGIKEEPLKAYAATTIIPSSQTYEPTFGASYGNMSSVHPEASFINYSDDEIGDGGQNYFNNLIDERDFLYTTNIYDQTESLLSASGQDLELIQGYDGCPIKHVQVSNTNTEDNFDDTEDLSLFVKESMPMVYFDENHETENKRISFYLKNFFDWDYYLNLLVNQFDLVGEMPALSINKNIDLLSIKFKGAGNGYEFISHNYATFEIAWSNPTAQTPESGAGPFLCLKVEMPYISSITNLSMLSLSIGVPYNEDVFFDDGNITFFKLHSDLKDSHYWYAFNLESFSATQSRIAIDVKSYMNYSIYEMTPILKSMKFIYSHTEKRTLEQAESDGVNLKVGTTTGNIHITEQINEEVEVTFNESDVSTDGSLQYWSFGEQWKPDSYDSGKIKIIEVTWTDKESNKIFVHDYSKTNIHTYSFNSAKSIRVYYYKMSGYYRNYTENSNNVYVGTGSYISGFLCDLFNIKNWQCYAFSFYFDNQRTMAIPNVQKIEVKYQCGYKEPNPNSEDGYYPNSDDPKKNAIVRTMKVVDGYYLFGRPVDDYGMTLTSDANEAMRTDDLGNEFDYVIYKLQNGKNLSTYITKMDPLKIHYETENQEMVQIVGNSKGLHVVLDEDGVYRVYDIDGNYCPDYGVGTGSDGTKFAGEDLNGDGSISEYESVNSDTGKVEQTPPTFDEAPGKNIFDDIKDWFNNLDFDFNINADWGRLIGFILVAVVMVAIVANPQIIVGLFKFIWTLISGLFKAIFSLFKGSGKKKR